MGAFELRAPWEVLGKKRAAFEYFILCRLKNDVNAIYPECKIKTLEDLLKDDVKTDAEEILSCYGWTRMNKLLYFTLLEDESRRQQERMDDRLRLCKLFDCFTAYPNGHVEAGLYENRYSGMFSFFSVGEGGYLRFKTDEECCNGETLTALLERVTETLDNELDGIKERLEEYLSAVLEWTKDYSTETLSAKSHLLPSWTDNSQNIYQINYGDISSWWKKELKLGQVSEAIEKEIRKYNEIKK